MSFDMNPADEDEHGECRHEIERLNAELREARRLLGRFDESVATEMTGKRYVGIRVQRELIERARHFLNRTESK